MPLIDLTDHTLTERPAGLEVYLDLKDSELRAKNDAAFGVYMSESSLVVRRSLAAGHQLVSMLVAQRYLESMADVIAAHPEVPVFVGTDEMLEDLTGFHVHRGALAAFARPEPIAFRDLLLGENAPHRVVFADDVNNHTNLGSIFRTAAALGWDAVALSESAADPFYRRAVRVSMGAVFTLPYTRVSDAALALRTLRDNGYTTVALELTDTAIRLDEFAASTVRRDGSDTKLALVLGAEGPGVTPEVLHAVDHHVMIPQDLGTIDHTGVDSLNVSQAAAIALWELRV